MAIGKLIWVVSNKADSLWVKWVHKVYLKGANVWDYYPRQGTYSCWRIIHKIKEKFRTRYEGTHGRAQPQECIL